MDGDSGACFSTDTSRRLLKGACFPGQHTHLRGAAVPVDVQAATTRGLRSNMMRYSSSGTLVFEVVGKAVKAQLAASPA